jgi:hypothetical protein
LFIRTNLPGDVLTATSTAVRIQFQGDGKTYKVTLSDGQGGGPAAKNPSWQANIPTTAGKMEQVYIPFDLLLPNFGGRKHSPIEDKAKYNFRASEIRNIGLMLSLKLRTVVLILQRRMAKGFSPSRYMYIRLKFYHAHLLLNLIFRCTLALVGLG